MTLGDVPDHYRCQDTPGICSLQSQPTGLSHSGVSWVLWGTKLVPRVDQHTTATMLRGKRSNSRGRRSMHESGYFPGRSATGRPYAMLHRPPLPLFLF
jgi:hypothetical protein